MDPPQRIPGHGSRGILTAISKPGDPLDTARRPWWSRGMRFELHPEDGAPQLPLGAERERAEAWLAELGQPRPFRRTPDAPAGLTTTRASGLAVFLELDQRGRLRSIEFGRPDDGADHADEVTVDGVDVFGDAADEVMHRLGARTSLREEDGGRTAVLDAYTVALWRPTLPEGPDDEEGRRFEAALVGVDGYFDADAASSG